MIHVNFRCSRNIFAALVTSFHRLQVLGRIYIRWFSSHIAADRPEFTIFRCFSSTIHNMIFRGFSLRGTLKFTTSCTVLSGMYSKDKGSYN